MMMEYEQVRKNILLHIYLFSSEMKRRSTRQKEKEREKAILYLSSSLSLPSSRSSTTMTKKEKERGGIELMNNSLQAILGENKRKLSRTDINLRAMLNKK
jgi:hypothetical protein